MHIADTLLYTEEDTKKDLTIEDEPAHSKTLDRHQRRKEEINKKQ